PCGDGGKAVQATLNAPIGVAVGRDGSLYIVDGTRRVRKVTPDGTILTVAGTGGQGHSGDGGPATQATFQAPFAVAVGSDDSVYVNDRGDNRVRWLRPDGIINALAGTGVSGSTGDGGPATQAQLQELANGLVVGPDNSVYVSQIANNTRVRKISPPTELFSAGELMVP